jgi:hypothetical protein
MAFVDCLVELEQALGKALSEDEKKALSGDLKAIIENLSRDETISDLSTAIKQATEKHTEEIILQAAVEKRTTLLNQKRQIEAMGYLKGTWRDDPGEGFLAILGNSLVDRWNSKNGVAAHVSAKTKKYVMGVQSKIIKEGLEGVAKDPAIQKDLFLAMNELSLEAPDNAKLSNMNPQVVKLAKILGDAQETARLEANKAGAWITKRAGFVMRRVHDSVRIRNAAGEDVAGNDIKAHFKAWRDFVDERLDWQKMSRTILPENRGKFLREIWTQFSAGAHVSFSDGGQKDFSVGGKNMAKGLSQGRVFEFKTPEAEFEYNQKFGNPDGVIGNIMQGLQKVARDTAIMERLGPNAEMNLKAVAKEIRAEIARIDPDKLTKFDKKFNNLMDNLWTKITGTADRPTNLMSAKIQAGFRGTFSAGDLSSASLASVLGDLPSAAGMLNYGGERSTGGMFGNMAYLIKSHIDSFGTNKTERFLAATDVGIMLDSLGTVTHMLGDEVATPGFLHKLLQNMFKWTGLTRLQDNIRFATAEKVGARYAAYADMAYKDLPEGMSAMLRQFGVNEKGWDAWRSAEKIERKGGYSVLGPDAIDNLPVEKADQLPEVVGRKAEILEKNKALAKLFIQDTEKDVVTFEKRKAKIAKLKEDYKTAYDNYISRKEKSTDKAVSELSDRIELAKLKIEKAEVSADIDAYLKTEIKRTQMGRYIDRVEAGDLFSDVAKDKLNDALDRYSQTRGRTGENLGARRKSLETKISDLEKKIKSTVQKSDLGVFTKQLDLAEKFEDLRDRSEMIEKKVMDRISERTKLYLEYQDKIGGYIDKAREQAKINLKDNLSVMFSEYGRMAATETSAVERAITVGGLRPGSWRGEAIRYGIQYKQFAVNFFRMHLGRELHGYGAERLSTLEALKNMIYGKNPRGAAGIANLVAWGTAMGYGTLVLKDLKNGREPRKVEDAGDAAKLFAASMAQAGALAIYGDFLFGPKDRGGKAFSSTVLGPLGRRLDDSIDLYQAIREGEDFGAKSWNFVKNNTPGLNTAANSLYTKQAFDYLIGYRMMELANPGSLRRMESRIQKDNNQEFFVPPSQVIPYGGK